MDPFRFPKILIEIKGDQRSVKLYGNRRDRLELEKLLELSVPKYDVIIEASSDQTKLLMELKPEFEHGDFTFQDLLFKAGITKTDLLIDLESGWLIDRKQQKLVEELCRNYPYDHPVNLNYDQFVEIKPQEYGPGMISSMWDRKTEWLWLGEEGWLTEGRTDLWKDIRKWFPREWDTSKFTNEVLGVPMGADVEDEPYPGCSCISCARARKRLRMLDKEKKNNE